MRDLDMRHGTISTVLRNSNEWAGKMENLEGLFCIDAENSGWNPVSSNRNKVYVI